MVRNTRSSPGGIAARAMAGIECALLDITARSLGISVAQLLGGPTRERIRLYWSHCGTTRVRHHEIVGQAADQHLRRRDRAREGSRRARLHGAQDQHRHAGQEAPRGRAASTARWDRTTNGCRTALLAHIEKHIGTIRDAVGPNFDINLDLNFHFKPEACMRIAKVLEPYNLHWLEIDTPDPDALRQIKDSTSTKICTGETLVHMKEYLPFFQRHAADVYMLDVPWNGIAQGKKVGDLAATFQHNVAPHNHYSHLSTFMSANLCATLSNVRIMEIDIDDVPWKDDLVTNPPEIKDGYMTIPEGPGLGTAVNEEVARAHPWKPGHAHVRNVAAR